MREKGTLNITALQCVLNGAPRVGKSTLLSRLVPSSTESPTSQLSTSGTEVEPKDPPFTTSTGVAECVIKVTVKQAMTMKAMTKASRSQKPMLQLPSASDAESTDTSASSVASGSETTEDQPTPADSQNKALHSFFRFGRRRAHQRTSSSFVIPILAGFMPPLDFFKEALRSDKWATVEAILEGSVMLYFTDTGGQTVFQEVLSALIAGPAAFFLVFKINDRLDQKYKIEYIQSAEKKTVPYESRFTAKEALLQSLASISSVCSYMSRSGKELVAVRPKVILVGTHKDLASEEHIRAVQRELKDTLQDTEYYREGSLVFASRDEPVVTVNNLSSEGEDTQKVRDIVERIA